ncbi:hypothetical protein DFH09DRAFT_1082521 [Mycena vulgaris]|nr:hypothetical protein DFH09DRAFT_1082521 [Mycena vulgaris]
MHVQIRMKAHYHISLNFLTKVMSSTDTVLSPLQDFMHEVFMDMPVSTDDALFEAVLHKFVSPSGKDSDVATSTELTRAELANLVRGLRTQFTERKFVRETCVIATPADPTNKSGALSATHLMHLNEASVQNGRTGSVELIMEEVSVRPTPEKQESCKTQARGTQELDWAGGGLFRRHAELDIDQMGEINGQDGEAS